jgi:hypothetical protein
MVSSYSIFSDDDDVSVATILASREFAGSVWDV